MVRVQEDELLRRSLDPRTGLGLRDFFGPSDFCMLLALVLGTVVLALGMVFLVTG